MAHVERFAPSPTGLLHLGHAFSALTAWDHANAANGSFLLRIEDTDQSRARPEFEQAIFDDLRWLGLDWSTPVLRQSNNLSAYTDALRKLTDLGLTYACKCARADIKAAATTPRFGPDGIVYPGICRDLGLSPNSETAVRLNMAKAIQHLGGAEIVNKLTFTDIDNHIVEHSLNTETLVHECGDIVLARKDTGTSYHLSVVVDDAAQNITHVTRGLDLFEATQIHRLLQALLGLPTPIYRHHRLILDDEGKRLAKSYDSRAIRKYRQNGATPQDIRELVGLGDG